MFTKQKFLSDAAFKTWPFSFDFNFACKDGRVTTATSKCYCPLVVNPTITNCCKEFHLKCGKAPRSVFENIAIHENYSSFMWKPVFFLYSKMFPSLSKVIVFFSYFLQYDEVFLISLLDICYHYLVFVDPVKGCSKSKYLVKD